MRHGGLLRVAGLTFTSTLAIAPLVSAASGHSLEGRWIGGFENRGRIVTVDATFRGGEELTGTIDKLKAEANAQMAAEQQALQVYRTMTTLPGEERLKGIDALQKIDQSKLSPFAKLALQDRAVLLRKEVGGAVLEKGKTAFRKQDWPETISQLSRFLSMDPVEEDALDASFFLGNAYFQSRKYADAIKPLTRFVEGDKKAKMRDFALLMLMQSYDMTGNKDQAVAMAKEGWQTYPSSDFRNQFINRLQKTVAQPAAAPAPAAPAPAAAPAPTPAAPPPGTR